MREESINLAKRKRCKFVKDDTDDTVDDVAIYLESNKPNYYM